MAAYRAALEVLTRESLPEDWAMTQTNLGIALQEQGIRTAGEAGAKLLSEAVAAGLPGGARGPHPREPAAGLGRDPEQPGECASRARHPHRGRGRRQASERGRRGLPGGARGPHPREPAAGLGQDPEQPS
ncbi:MAG: hypothetical protein H0U97_00485 [Gammaproteobacteria bacterium]|nr:hypothetical protein [Gammaproteobacteria bacterium]